MPSKLGNALPLFIDVIVQESQVVSAHSGLLHNSTQVKVKEVYLTEWTLIFLKKCPSHSKMLL